MISRLPVPVFAASLLFAPTALADDKFANCPDREAASDRLVLQVGRSR